MSYVVLFSMAISTMCGTVDTPYDSDSATFPKIMPADDCSSLTHPLANPCHQNHAGHQCASKIPASSSTGYLERSFCDIFKDLVLPWLWGVLSESWGFLSVAASILGGWYANYRNQNMRIKKETLMHLYQEIDKPELMDARVKTNRLIAMHLPLGQNLKSWHDNELKHKPYVKTDCKGMGAGTESSGSHATGGDTDVDVYIEDLAPIWFLTGFYERLEKSIQLKLIDKRESAETFFGLFAYFYLLFIEQRLGRKSTCDNLKNQKSWQIGDALCEMFDSFFTQLNKKSPEIAEDLVKHAVENAYEQLVKSKSVSNKQAKKYLRKSEFLLNNYESEIDEWLKKV